MTKNEKYVPVLKYKEVRRKVIDVLQDTHKTIFGDSADDDNGRWASLIDEFNSRMADEIDDGSSVSKARRKLHVDFRESLFDIIKEELDNAITDIEDDLTEIEDDVTENE